jgi:L,D-peptidoglycan transpeptidase YkuD (ErfK/YbiS/YcfS/YnhG family)
MEDQVFPDVVEDPVIVHVHRPSQECTSCCYAVPSSDLHAVLRPAR